MSGASSAGALGVTVVILNYNALKETTACLDALGPPPVGATVIVVDNGSPQPAATLRDTHPWALLLETGKNLGFGGGMNRALQGLLAASGSARRSASAPTHALLLNNDVRISWRQVADLAAFAHAHPEAGIVGPVVVWPNGDFQSAGGRFSPRSGWSHDTRRDQPLPDWPDYLVGCALIVDLAALRKVGLFDECFFLFAEEKDLCLRFVRAGYRIGLAKHVRVVHGKSKTVSRNPYLRYYQFARSNLLFRRKWRSLWPRMLSIPLWAFRFGWNKMVRQREFTWAVLRGYCRGLWRGLRDPLDKPGTAAP